MRAIIFILRVVRVNMGGASSSFFFTRSKCETFSPELVKCKPFTDTKPFISSVPPQKSSENREEGGDVQNEREGAIAFNATITHFYYETP